MGSNEEGEPTERHECRVEDGATSLDELTVIDHTKYQPVEREDIIEREGGERWEREGR